MLTTDQINDLHHLYWAERWPIRKIEQHLHMSWRTIRKYLETPAQTPAARPRISKLDPFKATIAELLEKDPAASAAVIEQRLRPLGYDGGHTILRDYVHKVRPQLTTASAPSCAWSPRPANASRSTGGTSARSTTQGDQRKLYAFALVDGHSRMLYLEFTHSQSFETFVRCHIHAFTALNGVRREICYDNLATAVAEHDGRLVRFHPRFLAFAREYNFVPRACNPASGWEKGKVERGGIGYVRQNFWPLREFTDLHDVNRQARQWLTEVANQRLHQRNPRSARSIASARCPTPAAGDPCRLPRHRRGPGPQGSPLAVRWQSLLRPASLCRPPAHGESRFQFRHHLRPRTRKSSPTRACWRRGQTFGAERFEKELAEQRPGGPALAGTATAARFSRRPLRHRRCRSLSARHGR